ncbi:GATOR2 complex protein WDR59 isoform X2 [Procambarus clarkii]|uniref:GATOR2 complex protein WDR59 isoform X2 n=1 Tax=Procambarus clarkii TaxID=6728 RepID=UPI001E6707B8|nr:GATOR complex protein WDR59-like isoform X2 [Procambarus clarkii]
MAVRWSSENVVAEHRDLQANAMALDWRGEYTLLAGRRNLALISLDKPSEVVKRVSRTRQKYDVTAAEWNPIQSQGHTFVLASGERAEICQWTEGSLNGTTSLRAHTRTITDLNWHRFDPHILATCSIDTFVHIWDTRETRKPVASLSAIAGASQVKWNKLNRNFLASGHDCNIRVWDNRKTSQPAQYIAAHLSKIQGLDWSPNHENHLVTSSNDCTVKFFDVTNPRKAENFINTPSPVWRARYTPFGEGVVTVVVPQLRRGENSLLLWSVTEMSSPVHTFVGHSDVVLEFEWRQNTHNPGEHQLVTWARDHSLRIWKIDQQLQRLCGHDADDDAAFVESTDSEFANEAAPAQGEAQCDVERFIEKDVKDAEENIMDLEEDTELKCTPKSAENTQDISHENSPEVGSAGDAPQMSTNEVAQTMNDEATGESVTVNATILQPVASFSNTMPTPCRTNTAVVGSSSTLPSGSVSVGQPMSLQQEFSLLNTSLDNSQVNSVEVVGGGAKILADAGDRTQGQQVTKPAGEEGILETRLENIACEETRSHDGDGSGLVTAVENLEQDLKISNLDMCHINLMDNKKSVFDVYNEDIISCHVKPVASLNNELGDFQRGITCDVTRQLALKKTSNEIKPLPTSYFTGLETSNHDLISKVNFDTSSMCIIKVKSLTNYPELKSHEEEQRDYANKEESPVRISVNSEGGNQFPIQPATQDSESLVLMPGDLEASLLRETREHDSSNSSGVSIISLSPEAPSVLETEIEKRLCQVTAKHRSHTVALTINFPLTYPRQHTPIFRFSYGTTIDYACKTELLKVLKNTASQYQRKRKACLEPCIRVFVIQLKLLLGDDRMNSVDPQLGSGYPGQVYGSYQDHRVPFPRTSGARFSSAGILVCFARPTFMKKGSSRTESATPRSLSALGAYITNFMPQISGTVPTSPKYNYMYPAISHSPSAEQSISISNYYYQDKKVKSKRGKNEEEAGRSFKAGSVLIYDVKSLMPFSKDLGASYVLDENDIVGTCTRNRDAAAAVSRKDLVQVWSLAAATASLGSDSSTNASDYTDSPWTHHPFARKLINSILDHYLTLNDVQTATMLCCVFGTKTEPQNTAYMRKGRTESNSHLLLDRFWRKTGGSPYNTIHCLSLEGWDTCTVRHNRSNSEGSLSEAARPSQEVDLPALESTDTLQKTSARFLDCNRSQQFDEMKRAYADILYRWGLLQQRAMILKYLQVQPPAHKGVEFQTDCVHCGQSAKGPQCLYCRRFSFSCAICHVAVKGASNFCVVCGHGGHAYHLLEWFRDHNECPTGCGCDCIDEMDNLFR